MEDLRFVNVNKKTTRREKKTVFLCERQSEKKRKTRKEKTTTTTGAKKKNEKRETSAFLSKPFCFCFCFCFRRAFHARLPSRTRILCTNSGAGARGTMFSLVMSRRNSAIVGRKSVDSRSSAKRASSASTPKKRGSTRREKTRNSVSPAKIQRKWRSLDSRVLVSSPFLFVFSNEKTPIFPCHRSALPHLIQFSSLESKCIE